MDNKLSFKTVHKSIIGLSDINLPNLVVLTGRNGSGKTHLLEAINEGNVSSTLVPNFKTDVWTSQVSCGGTSARYRFIKKFGIELEI
jgi:AAA15 family ATPase/GTPase